MPREAARGVCGKYRVLAASGRVEERRHCFFPTRISTGSPNAKARLGAHHHFSQLSPAQGRATKEKEKNDAKTASVESLSDHQSS